MKTDTLFLIALAAGLAWLFFRKPAASTSGTMQTPAGAQFAGPTPAGGSPSNGPVGSVTSSYNAIDATSAGTIGGTTATIGKAAESLAAKVLAQQTPQQTAAPAVTPAPTQQNPWESVFVNA